jgi:hypothetical protein
MLKLLSLLLSLSILQACSNRNQDVNLQEKLKKDTTINSQQIIFAEPQTIDSSHYVIYPLILEKERYDDSYGSSSGGQRTNYWNLIFYNTETKTQHLLTVDKKILIYSINLASSSTETVVSSGINIFKDNIIYTAVASDFNRNNQLDKNDPTYLFISNRDGTNFRQISPNDYNINSWEVVKGTSKIIMQGQKSDSSDKVLSENSVAIPFIVDVNSQGPAVETFTKNFIDTLQQGLVRIWKH